MRPTVTIAEQFRGPPSSGNGGYVSGVFAAQLAHAYNPPTCNYPPTCKRDALQVTLRAPTPLDQSLQIVPQDADHLQVWDSATLVAEIARTVLDIDPPPAPSFAQALAHRDASPAFTAGINPLIPNGVGFHPICFCCGADVPEGEGLRVFAAPVDGFEGVAAAWHPHPSFYNEAGVLAPAIIWAALDCPGQFAYYAAGIRTGMLGRMTARLLAPVQADDDLVITGWRMQVEGKKHFAGTALFDSSGKCCAISKQVWIGRHD